MRIQAACERAGRHPDEVTLLAVSKKMPVSTIEEAAELGLVEFGENRIQEAKTKIPMSPPRLRWHMIGHLQTNKCREAVGLFHTIQSVDSLRVANELEKCADRQSRSLSILIEVNVAGESTKFGYSPESLLRDLDQLAQFRRLDLFGLMTMAPYSPDRERSRGVFRRLRELRTTCEDRLGVPLPQLSMGMTNDFEVAIEEGSTLVRIGTALFGERTH